MSSRARAAASRRIGPFHDGHSLSFAVRNANKRRTTVDLDDDAGTARLLEMLGSADIWIESSRPGALARFGLDPAEVSRALPELVVVSISDFGQTGPYRDHVATDPVMVGLSWMLFRAGIPELPPVLPPGSLAYDVAGITAAFAAVTGLVQRGRTGRGQHIDLSVMESVAQTTDWGLASYSVMARNGVTGMSQVRIRWRPDLPDRALRRRVGAAVDGVRRRVAQDARLARRAAESSPATSSTTPGPASRSTRR